MHISVHRDQAPFYYFLTISSATSSPAPTSHLASFPSSVDQRSLNDPIGYLLLLLLVFLLVVVLGVVAIVGGIGVQGQNIAFLVALAFAVAASANLPTILYSLYWRKFTTRGALWSMYGGLTTAIVLILFSKVVSGAETAMLGAEIDFAWFPLNNPGIVSIPVGFLLGWLGSVLPQKKEDPRVAAEMDVRSLTGYGAEEAVEH